MSEALIQGALDRQLVAADPIMSNIAELFAGVEQLAATEGIATGIKEGWRQAHASIATRLRDEGCGVAASLVDGWIK